MSDRFVGRWVDATGKVLVVEEGPQVTALDASGAVLARDLPATEDGDTLVIEAGMPGIGPTVVLAADGGVRVRMGLYDDFDDDLGVPWAFPLSRYIRS